MLASNLERGRDNIMQTGLPSHADAIFGTVGGLCTKPLSLPLLNKNTYFINFNVACVMQDILDTLAAPFMNALMDTKNKSSSICEHNLNEHNSNSNITRTSTRMLSRSSSKLGQLSCPILLE